jgi:hypothetical protein
MPKQVSLLFAANILLAVTFIGCQTETPIKYPEGGYNYPITVTDSNYYFYPLQKIFSRRDSFWKGMMYISYKAFDEPNLSLAPANEDIFRLYFDGFEKRAVVITLTKHQITVKKRSKWSLLR